MTNEAASLEWLPAGHLLVCATIQRWLEPQARAGSVSTGGFLSLAE